MQFWRFQDVISPVFTGRRSPGASSEPEEYPGSASVSISIGTLNSSADNLLSSEQGDIRAPSAGVDASVGVGSEVLTHPDVNDAVECVERNEEDVSKSTVSTGTSPPPQNMSTQVILSKFNWSFY